MELEQSTIIKFLHFEKINAAESHKKLVLCSLNDIHTFARAHHSVHEFKIGRVSIEDDPRPGKRRLHDFDAAIFK
jgi:hypothetical protein